MALFVEEKKTGMIHDGRPLNKRVKRFPFSMDTVARVANVATQVCYMTSLDDTSAFHHILLRPSSWPLFGFCYEGVDYVVCPPLRVQSQSVGVPYPQRGQGSLSSFQRHSGTGVPR